MWKKFNFFTAELLQSADPGSPLYAIQGLDITCVAAGKGSLLFGDSEGGITIADQEYSLRRFTAHDSGVNFAYQYTSSNMLLTIGDGTDFRSAEEMQVSRNLASRFRSTLKSNDSYKWMLDDLKIQESFAPYFSMKNATLKLFLLDTVDENGNPLCVRSFKIFDKIDEQTITSLVVDETNQLIVFGCESGDVFLIQGDLSRAKKCVPILLPKHLHSSITNLHFSQPTPTNCIPLFVTTADQIGCYLLPRETKLTIGFELLEDASGCPRHCACVDAKGQLIAARSEGLFAYSPESRGDSLLLPGEKSCLFSYHDSLVVSRQMEDSTWFVDVLNVENSCQEYELQVLRNGNSECVTWVWVEWGLLFVMTEGHVVYLLREKANADKLAILYERKLFPLALALSESWGIRDHDLSDVHQQYADWLYKEGDEEAAMKEYVLTVPYTDASYVIRRYLDAAQIHMLIRYLEQLHRQGVAWPEHTLLLVNCYTKLHDRKKLRQFIDDEALQQHCDIPTAIDALVTAEFYPEALELAERHRLYERVVEIQIEKTHALEEALTFIAKLSDVDAAAVLMRSGKRLVDAVPDLATPFFIKLCTEGQPQEPAQFFICFVDDAAHLKQFLAAVTQQRQQKDPVVWNTYLELTLRPDLLQENEDRDAAVLHLLQRPDAAYESDEALILLQRYHCELGLVYLYQKLHMQAMLLQQYYHMGRRAEALALCQQNGKEEPELWELLLQQMSEASEVDESELRTQLAAVEASGRVPLLRIIQILSENPRIPSSLVKELVVKQLRVEKSIADADAAKQAELQTSVDALRKELATLENHAFAFGQTRCVACGLGLEQPVVHFLCGHSFHKACVDLEKGVCPRCGEKKEEKCPLSEEGFAEQMKNAQDGFAFVADCYGKGMFREEEAEEAPAAEPAKEPAKEAAKEEEFDEDTIPIQTLDL